MSLSRSKNKRSKSEAVLALLRRYESRNVTFIEPDGSWPIVWERAKGVHVWDAEGKKYLDLTAAFGVAAAGHANPRVVRAGQTQMARLLHAMGDVHPHVRKAELARELSHRTFERWRSGEGKSIFCNSGFEAVEAALKTAMLATGKPGVVAFEGAYHGLGYGTLNATHRRHFRGGFLRQLAHFGHFVPFPRAVQDHTNGKSSLLHVEAELQRIFKSQEIGGVLVEPIQVRGGINVPPPEFLPLLRRLCDEHRALLILDEIYTGFGRTGKWFACEHTASIPDLLCLGKALTGGFPLSVCIGRASIMDTAWPTSAGEAIHTSTFLGHPVGCAMALAQIKEIETQNLVQNSAKRGKFLLQELIRPTTNSNLHANVRGLGLLAGLELLSDGKPATDKTLRAIKTLLHRGFMFLPEGEHANVLSFTPPLTISERQLGTAVKAVMEVLSLGNL